MTTARQTMTAPQLRLLPGARGVLGLGLAALFIVWIAVLGDPAFPLDDAYITLHNAQSLLSGVDRQFGASPLLGATSSVHLLLVTALGLIVSLPWAAAVVAWGGAGLYLLGLSYLAHRRRLTPAEHAALLFTGAFTGMTAFQLLNGLETGLAMAAVVWALALASGPPSRILPALLALIPFIRPELALLAGPLMAHRVLIRARAGAWRALAGDFAIGAAVAAPWLIWLWIETGSIVPQTAAAKRAFFAEAASPAADKARVTLSGLWVLFEQIGPVAFGALGLWSAASGRAGLFFLAAALAIFGILMPGGLHHNMSRYLYVLVPVLIVGLVLLCAGARSPTRRRCAGTIIIASALFSIALSPSHLRRYAEWVAYTRIELEGVAVWMRRNVSPGPIVAVHDAGYIAYATPHRLLDMVGLMSPASRVVHEQVTAPSAGLRRGEALARILIEGKADYLVVRREWDAIFSLTAGIRAAGVRLTPARTEGDYRVFTVDTAP